MSGELTTAHKAGPLVGDVQHCTVCGRVMADYTNAVTSNPSRLRGWREGAWVAMSDASVRNGVLLSAWDTEHPKCGAAS